MGEVELGFPAGWMLLGEVHLLSGPLSARLLSLSKGRQSSLQGAELGSAEPAGMLLPVILSLPKGIR